MENFIGMHMNLRENIKPEYLSKSKLPWVFIEIEKDKKYGAVARLFERKHSFSRLDEKTSKKEKEEMSRALDRAFKDDKPTDTSKWVRPDEESIRNELIENLFLLEILKEGCWQWHDAKSKAQAYHWILHARSPMNPQGFLSHAIDPFFETILAETKSAKFDDYMKIHHTKENGRWVFRPRPVKEARKMYQEFREDCLKSMILKEREAQDSND